jgi:hypothetical protein
MENVSAVFPRNFRRTLPFAVRGEGCWIEADDGRRLLDASGQAAVVSIGHGVREIGQAMAEQSSQIAFAHTSQFHSASAEKLAACLLALAPANFHNGGRVYFTSGGSEATETAIKLVRQYHMERNQTAARLARCRSAATLLGARPMSRCLQSGGTSRRAFAIAARLK